MRFLFKAGLAFCLIVLILLGLRQAGPALVVNQPQRSDVILLLAGDENDTRYWKGIELLRAGYAPRMLVDGPPDCQERYVGMAEGGVVGAGGTRQIARVATAAAGPRAG